MGLREKIENKMLDTDFSLNKPKALMLELTNACNHECFFCVHRKSKRKLRMMDKSFAKRILKEGYDMGIREVGLFIEGESFLYNNIAEIVKTAKEIGYGYIYCTTNGAYATPSKLKEVIDAGLDSIKFSINAVDRENYKIVHGKDDFEKVIDNLKWAYDYKVQYDLTVNVYVSSVVTKFNFEKERIYKLLRPISDEVVIYRACNIMGMISDVEDFFEVDNQNNEWDGSAKLPCTMVFNRAHVTVEGYLTACCTDVNNYLAYADLNEKSLQEAWQNEIITKLRNMHLAKKVTGTLCANCISGKWLEVEPLVEKLSSECDVNAGVEAVLRRISAFE